MKKEVSLLVMAAGMGSRFGGLKQIEPMGPNGEFLIDYSVYDALKAGFNKIVFVIKEENFEIFKDTIGSRIPEDVLVEYVFQKIEDVPVEVEVNREKPWGTGQAILSAKDVINGPFLIINADDFYGYDAFKKSYDHITTSEDYCLVGYPLGPSLSKEGVVKRGICLLEDDYLKEIVESKCYEKEDSVLCISLDEKIEIEVKKDCCTSANMLGFNESLFSYLEKDFKQYLENSKENILECEYLIPNVLTQIVKEGYKKVKIVKTTSEWFGVTFKEDTEKVRNEIKNYVDKGVYPNNLWK
ncbi:MAG: sugar phosphate nucleotidyltransferase [bacterium]